MVDVFLPIARMSVPAFSIIGLGGLVGLLSGMFGVGGGFLMTPLLMMLGIPPAVAVASDTNQIVAASVSGTLAHGKNKNVDFKLGLIIVTGGLIGGSLGTVLVRILTSMGNFEVVLKGAYVVMLFVVGTFMLLESLSALNKNNRSSKAGKKPLASFILNRLPMKIYFEASGIESSAVALLALGLLTGVLSALMGVGGGFIMLPVMIYLIGMPVRNSVGTSAFVVFFTAINVTIAQSVINHTVDIVLAMMLLIGSSAGVQIGARLGRKLNAVQLRVVFSVVVLLVMVKMTIDLMSAPSDLIVLGGGH